MRIFWSSFLLPPTSVLLHLPYRVLPFAIPTSTPRVHVFDNVLSPFTCQQVHELAMDHADRCESSIVICDGGNNNEDKTPLEQVLCQIVQQVSGDNKCNSIEYWSRTEYMNMDAHIDIDEGLFENEGKLRYPDYSHVLYLFVNNSTGTNATHPLFPTCIFASSCEETSSVMSVVPAVPGRLLRFPGNLRHAVPKPLDRWLLSKQEREKREEDSDDWDWSDDDDEDNDRIERSVLLFNVWSNQGPSDVRPDVDIPEGIEIIEDDSSDDIIVDESQKLVIHCNEKEVWSKAPAHHVNWDASEQQHELYVKLMGNHARRQQAEKHLSFLASSDHIRSALNQGLTVSTIELGDTERLGPLRQQASR